MRYSLVPLACFCALAACNKSPEVSAKNASVAEVARKVGQSGVASDSFIRAGQWRVTGTMEEINVPGMPPEAQAQMKRIMGQVQNASYEYCVPPEEAKRPQGKMFTGKDDGSCRYEHFTMGGGKFDAAMQCQGEGRSQVTKMTMNGTYSPDGYQTRVTMNVEGGPQGSMSMKMHSEARRIGECSAGKKEEAKG